MRTLIMLAIGVLAAVAVARDQDALACFWVLCLIGIKVEQIHNAIEAAHGIKENT
jgi:hypothetical protein